MTADAGLNARVYKMLEDKILAGKYPVGAWLTECGICMECGVSRTPVRAALQRLEQEGLVRLVPNKGAVVVGISDGDLIDIYRMRTRLEGLAASMAAERLTEDDLKKLTENVELAEYYIQKGNAAHLRDLDSNFHEVVYLASGSRMLCQTLSDLHRKIGFYRAMSLSDHIRGTESVSEHRAILEAMKAHDAAGADALAARHVERALQNLLSMIREKRKT